MSKPKIKITLVDKIGTCGCHRGHKIGDTFDYDTDRGKLCPINCIKPTQNPMKTIHRRSVTDLKSWIGFWKAYPWMITMLFGTFVANFALLMNIKHFLMVSDTELI